MDFFIILNVLLDTCVCFPLITLVFDLNSLIVVELVYLVQVSGVKLGSNVSPFSIN